MSLIVYLNDSLAKVFQGLLAGIPPQRLRMQLLNNVVLSGQRHAKLRRGGQSF
jgi:hypothetical protein